jgi:hypothetical protein
LEAGSAGDWPARAAAWQCSKKGPRIRRLTLLTGLTLLSDIQHHLDRALKCCAPSTQQLEISGHPISYW